MPGGEALRPVTEGALTDPPEAGRTGVPMSSRSSYDVLVLGAGVVGINTAYFALRQGLSVCVVDRQPGAGS